MRSRIALLLAAATLPIAGCGGSDSASDQGKDPAALVPADAPLYVEGVVRPEGDLRDGAVDALKKLLRTDDPGKKIDGLLDEASADSEVKWDDVKEWLGPRVGIFVTDFSGDEPVAAGVVNITDEEKAKEDLGKLAKEADDSLVWEIVDGQAVVGTRAGVDAVKAVAEGGRPLSDVPDYTEAREAVGADDDLGVFYMEPQGLLDAVGDQLQGMEGSPFQGAQALDLFRQIFAKAGRSLVVGLHADGDALRIDGSAIGAETGPDAGAAADSLRALPSDAWLAIGLGDIGTSLNQALAQFQQLASAAGPGAPDFDKLLSGFEKRTGIDIQQDFLSWMGSGAIYARGRSIADIGAALTIETKDPAKSTKAVGILARGLARAGATVRPAKVEGYDVAVELRNPQIPVSLFIAANQERFSIGINPQALAAVNDPDETLGDSDRYGTAKDTLGGLDPVALIDTPTVISLLETFGLGDVDGYDKVKPYLDAIGPISIGTAHDGDVSRFSFAVGLR